MIPKIQNPQMVKMILRTKWTSVAPEDDEEKFGEMTRGLLVLLSECV